MIAAILSTILIVTIVGASLYLRDRAVIIVHKEHPDMATILDRLAALESTLKAQATSASADSVTVLAQRVTAIEAEIGTDPEPVTEAASPIAAPAASV